MKPLSRAANTPVSATFCIDLCAKELQKAGRDVISFCVGEPDFSAPQCAIEAGVCAIREGETRYTHVSGTPQLKRAVCGAFERDAALSYRREQIAVTSGAKYAVFASALALCDPGDEVILPAPCWTSYAPLLRLANVTPVLVPCAREEQWLLTPARLRHSVTARTKAVILNQPSNPTGAVYPRALLEALASEIVAADLYVIADEIYASLVYPPAVFCPVAGVSDDMYARTVTIGGVSKRYAMTGFRIGYAAGSEQIIRGITAVCSHTTGCPSAPSQAAAAAALIGPQDDVYAMRDAFSRRRDLLLAAFADMPEVSFVKPDGAFYFLLDIQKCLCGALTDDRAFAMALLESEAVAVVPGSDFDAPASVRLSYTLDDARMLEGVARIRRFLQNLRP